MAIACPSCGAPETRRLGAINPAFVFAGHRLSDRLEGGSLYRCSACALAFRHPMPTSERIASLYRTSDLAHWQYKPDRRKDWATTRVWLDKQSGRTVLDIGCFDGAFLQSLDESWTCAGIEINEKACERARSRGIEIIGQDLHELERIDRSFDAVVAFDVIEHVPDPAGLLESMSAVTRSGGSVILASGNFEAASWKMMGSSYWYCAIPEHLAFISKSWCERIGPTLGLELMQMATYSHEQNRTPKLALHELAANTLYRFFPVVFAALRRNGWGDKDTVQHDELALYPPTWTTAKDHLIAIYKKM
jgi:SAM-dependent methyltransferase